MQSEKKFDFASENSEINYCIPQESVSYVKLSTTILQWQPYLSPIQFTVLVYLVSRINKDRHYAWPSTKTAAADCNICEKSFISAVEVLEALGLIFVYRSNGGNRYYLKPPIEIDESLIENILPGAFDKYHKRKSKVQEKKQQYQLQFSKVIAFENKESNSTESNQAETDLNKVKVLKDVKHKQNLQNSNLEKQQQEKTIKNAVVVNFEQVEILKKYNINDPKMINELIHMMDSKIDLKDFIQYALFDYGKNVNINNCAGWIINAIRTMQAVYLENQYQKSMNQKQKKESQSIKEDYEQMKDHIYTMANKKWHQMNRAEQKKLHEEVYQKYKLHQFKFSNEDTLNLYYLDYIVKNYLGLGEEIIDLLDNDYKVSTEKNIKIRNYLVEKGLY